MKTGELEVNNRRAGLCGSHTHYPALRVFGIIKSLKIRKKWIKMCLTRFTINV